MISRARPLCVLTNAISSSASSDRPAAALEQLGGAENRLQRVVQLVRDARHEHADRRQPLLADDLALQRLQRLAHLALLLDLAIELSCVSRRLAAMVMNASCSCASSRFGTGVRTGGERSPSAIRCTASRTPLMPRPISVDRPSDKQQDRDDRRPTTIDDVAAEQRRQAADRHAGGNADAQQPGTAVDDRVAVEARARRRGPSGRCVRGTSFGGAVGAERLADVELRVAAAREHAAFRVGQRDHRPFRQRDVAEQRLQSP